MELGFIKADSHNLQHIQNKACRHFFKKTEQKGTAKNVVEPKIFSHCVCMMGIL